jgi:hypothetical protein
MRVGNPTCSAKLVNATHSIALVPATNAAKYGALGVENGCVQSPGASSVEALLGIA